VSLITASLIFLWLVDDTMVKLATKNWLDAVLGQRLSKVKVAGHYTVVS
jgi:hypothetical protein